jgi:tRNA(His) 5'-end guanylyltransferase
VGEKVARRVEKVPMSEVSETRFARMPEFETGPGQTILPEVHVVLQLAGDRFGRLIASPELGLTRPFDARFAKWLMHVASDLMHAFEQACFAFIGGDEISLLFGVGSEGFGRGGYRFAIRIAAHASVRLSLHAGRVATFVPHVFQLPSDGWMLRYFAWRQDALHSFGIDRYCRTALMKSGLDEAAVRRVMSELSDEEKREVLHEHGIDYGAAPAWQRRGILVGRGAPTNGSGGDVVLDSALPAGDEFIEALRRVWEAGGASHPK